MLHPDRAIHLGLRYNFLQPKDVEEVEKELEDPNDYNALKDKLIKKGYISAARMIMLESIVTEEKAYDKGDILGQKYKIIRPIGAGAMAKVILARNLETNQDVALKLVPVGEKDNKNLKYRFEQEFRLHSSLRHPNIITLYDRFFHDGRMVLAVEYINGESLASRLERGPIPLRQALFFALQVAKALSYLHHRDLVHRDIKPGNILLTNKGEVKLLDMGLAKNLKDPVDYTQMGTVLGTPQYMAPEQARTPHLVDGRADIYSLGVTLYHMITGRLPYRGTRNEILSLLRGKAYDIGIKRLTIPQEVKELLQKMLAHNPKDRYQDAELLVRDLKRILQNLEDHPLRGRVPNYLTALLVTLILAGALLGVAAFYFLIPHLTKP